MPPRRKWINPTKKERYPRGTIQRINSVEYNTKALLKTISFYETNNPSEPFLINLNQFIDEILKEVNSGLINLTTPCLLYTSNITKVYLGHIWVISIKPSIRQLLNFQSFQ